MGVSLSIELINVNQGFLMKKNNWFYTPFKIFYNFIFYESMRENNKGYFSAHQNWENP